MVADIEANNEEEALKLAEDWEYKWDENHSQDGGWSYNEAQEMMAKVRRTVESCIKYVSLDVESCITPQIPH